jgi:deoxycytidylate deaminase
MIVLIYGSSKSGKSTTLKYLESHSFIKIEYHKNLYDEIVSKGNWRGSYVSILNNIDDWAFLKKRPCFRLLIVFSPCNSDWRKENDDIFYKKVLKHKDAYFLHNFSSVSDLHLEIDKCITKIRPDWDRYFIKITKVVALRSNCMKGKVGAVLVKDNRIISTGYNGTPTGITNCYKNGCGRCNTNCKSNEKLDYCLCIHAEENALLFIGRERSKDSTLYVTVFPCQLCCRKIVQMGVIRIVYLVGYSKCDEIAVKVFKEAGIETKLFDL